MAETTRAEFAVALPRTEQSAEQGGDSARLSRFAPYGAALLTILLGWQLASLFFPSFLIPNPRTVLFRLGRELVSQKFLLTTARSFVRLGIGLPSLLGVVIGLSTGVWGPFRRYARALVSILQSIPPTAWAPLFIILLGFGDPRSSW